MAAPDTKPYKGWASYQAEDARLFFGRDREAEQVIAQILTSRFTLLHATSGAGKTSLLNARVLPLLEARGWTPVRIELLDNPVDAVRTATLHSLLPPPQAEVAAIKRAVAELSPGLSPDEDPPLGEILTLYNGLIPAAPPTRSLLKPLEGYATPDSVALSDFGKVLPYFCRLLRGSVSWDVFNEHLAAIGTPLDAEPSALRIDETTRAGELIELLSSPAFVEAYESLVEMLYLPLPDLEPFFENLIELYGSRRSEFSLVLVFDQFEELFTRFVDPGPVAKEIAVGLQDWRLRWELIRQLEMLYQVEEPAAPGGERPRLPLRFVLSMRDEFVAKLDPIRQFVPHLERSSFHLALLGLPEAQEAIQQPASEYGYRYTPECYTKIIEQLAIEGRYVEPIHIQIVCDKIWSVSGHRLAAQRAATAGRTRSLPAVELRVFEDLDESRGILRSFFQELIEDKETTDDERLEMLEMLQPLITPSGTRNIVAWDQLVSIPFRDRERREALLQRLLKGNVVRAERRLGGRFVEITHEFLISPIQDAIHEKLTASHEYGRFLDALRSLEMAQHRPVEGTMSPVSAPNVQVLAKNRQRLAFGYLGSELLLRSSLLSGHDRNSLATWVDLVERSGGLAPAADLLKPRSGIGEDRRPFARDELTAIDRARADLTPGRETLERILRSVLLQAADGDDLGREQILYWTRRAMRHEA